MKIPPKGKIYSVNEGAYDSFPAYIKAYLKQCKATQKTARYIGSLVADFHRNLLKGGIFMYPATEKAPEGKLRLLYECNALSFIIEQAGGQATDGTKNVLDIQPQTLHQRIPFIVGSREMVEEVMAIQKALMIH